MLNCLQNAILLTSSGGKLTTVLKILDKNHEEINDIGNHHDKIVSFDFEDPE